MLDPADSGARDVCLFTEDEPHLLQREPSSFADSALRLSPSLSRVDSSF